MNRDAQALLPLTIKQINDAYQASDDKANLTIDGVEIGKISLLGRVCSKAGQTTDVKFVLDDGTGMIECTKWLQEPANSIPVESILNGIYVRVYGHLKGFQGQNNNDQKSVEQLVSYFLLLPQNREMTEGTPHDVIREYLRITLDRLKLAIENLTYEGQIYEGVTDRYKSAIDG
ncbi:unnamed protein product [Vicia faba]|uniref:OB domain-containing protein n=1 Tax=Vicia faba TaxID=3906 RepID=A0AAV1A0S2_VICFA|nr:unnamed protein product [Vicia faba]